MKIIYIYIILSFSSQLIICQNQCTSPEEVVDLNSINISKCAIKQESTSLNQKKTQKEVKLEKRVNNRFRSINKQKVFSNSLNKKGNAILNVSNSLNNTITSNKQLIFTNELLFALVDEIPLFPNCNNINKELNLKCFQTNLASHFAKKLDYERIVESGIHGKVLVQFIINTSGIIENTEIISSKKSKILIKEINRVISKIPILTTGKQEGIPVNVKYAFPISIKS